MNALHLPRNRKKDINRNFYISVTKMIVVKKKYVYGDISKWAKIIINS